MASLVTEEQIINKLAVHCRTIDGVKNAYGFAQNPDQLPTGIIPAIIFYPAEGEQERKAHYNRWTNTYNISGFLFVVQRMGLGGTLKYIENAALPFPQRFRAKFQTASVYEDFLSLGLQVADFTRYQYGADQRLLYQDIQYVGYIFQWIFKSTS